MSRGLGKMQRFWVQIAACDDSIAKPWSFAEICRNAIEIEEAAMRPALKRSLRRALADVVKFNLVICLGTRRGVFVRMGYRPARRQCCRAVIRASRQSTRIWRSAA
jgi:hypothetical protein